METWKHELNVRTDNVILRHIILIYWGASRHFGPPNTLFRLTRVSHHTAAT